MKRLAVVGGWIFVITLTWVVDLFHVAVFPKPKGYFPSTVDLEKSEFCPRQKCGINQLVLRGNPFERGYAAGIRTQFLLDAEEEKLFALFKTLLPYSLERGLFTLGVMRWFWGIAPYFEPWATDEMYGVSLSTSHRFDQYADRFTRQIAYHGVHEVGQLFVDMGGESMGCTVFAVPEKKGWVIGRNFDFEGGRIFDQEKIVKWVFPDEGFAYVSIIWAGMVGAVTGVNEHGVYLSINAAGSTDFRRFGTPSTLVVLRALQFAKTAREAKDIIERADFFITDLLVVADRTDAFRIEKSPLRTRWTSLKKASVVTNHLLDPFWAEDKINQFRRYQLTSEVRARRGEVLLASFEHGNYKSWPIEKTLLSFLRDKKAVGGELLHLGNRAAIDSLIATHSVIYDSGRQVLYVSQGPALVGPFRGYDLAASFRRQRPVEVAALAGDPEVTAAAFYELKDELAKLEHVLSLIEKKRCDSALGEWKKIKKLDHFEYAMVESRLFDCLGDKKLSLESAARAWSLKPAYGAQKSALQIKLGLKNE